MLEVSNFLQVVPLELDKILGRFADCHKLLLALLKSSGQFFLVLLHLLNEHLFVMEPLLQNSVLLPLSPQLELNDQLVIGVGGLSRLVVVLERRVRHL